MRTLIYAAVMSLYMMERGYNSVKSGNIETAWVYFLVSVAGVTCLTLDYQDAEK